MSVRLRLSLWYTGILAMMLIVFGVALYFFLSMTMMNQVKQNVSAYADKVYERMNVTWFLSFGGYNLDIQLDRSDAFRTEGIYLQVVNLVNPNVNRSGNAVEHGVEIPFSKDDLKRFDEEGAFFKETGIQGYPFLVYYKPLVYKGELVGVLQAAVYVGNNNDFLAQVQQILVISSLVVTVLAFTIGWFLAAKALIPIENVIAAANRIEKGTDLDKRILYDGPRDEIGRLTDTINNMLARLQNVYSELEESYRNQRRFVSDASHELRTPLTTIRGNVDLLEKIWKQASPQREVPDGEKLDISIEAMRDIASEAERMSRLVNDMLSLARADAGYEMPKEPVEFKPLVEEVLRKAQFLPRRVELVTCDLEALNDVFILGNRDYLQQLLFIFLENAFKYTFEGSVRLEIKRKSEQVGILVEDTGIGMEKDEVPQIFERFYRADVSRGQTSGTGLGLSIAKWIIDQHDGSIEVLTRKGEGTTFVIWLPVTFHLEAE
jgi:two-component system OmpR family sensor kinase